MKLRIITLLVLASIAAAACSDRIARVEIIPVQDNAAPRNMARGLFPDAPDSLFSALGLQDGMPSSVCAFLVRTEGKNILFDAANGAPDSRLPHVLDSCGVAPEDIDMVFVTHLHGDHIGGHSRLRQLGIQKVVSFAAGRDKVENPVPYAIATRTRFPAHSPAPQSFLQGVAVDIALEDGEVLADRLQLIHTPGHDDDCVCWLDIPTGTLITGDSLQANGTICQGIGRAHV